MSLTAYCKKCKKDVPLGECCPECGADLGKNPERSAWCIEHTPLRDWLSWNIPARLIFPAWFFLFLLLLLIELLSGGTGALQRMAQNGLLLTLFLLLAAAGLLTCIAFLLQGKDLIDCTVDHRGIHIRHYLPDPTPLKLLSRLKSPALMKQTDQSGEVPVLALDTEEIAWKDVVRVQCWPEKCTVLFYAPHWWMRVAAVCTPYTWDDVLWFVREKLGKKKKVSLPEFLHVTESKGG